MAMSVEWTEEVWRGLVESAPDALVMVDSDGIIAFVSAQTEKIFGYPRNELLGQSIECLLPQRYRNPHVEQRAGYFKTPHVRPMGAASELFALHKDGREIPVEISLSPFSTAQGVLVTAAIRDSSDRRRVQDELKKARESAEAANRSKSEFLANMSHEIRTPLAGILGYAEMIALYCHSAEERKSYMEKIRRCSETLTELIGDILDLSKVEAGALKLEKVSFNLVSEVEAVASLLEGRATQKQISFEVNYERPFPPRIVSDPTRLRQILANLIGNAIKFTEKGKVTLRVCADRNQPHWLTFTVSDTGCGLSAHQKEGLFQPFVQADSSTTRKYGGTGLGLALSRRLAEALKGQLVLLESEPGKGSTFVLTIPVGVCGSVPLAMATEKKCESYSRASLPRLDGMRVLVAEDNLDNQEILRRLLGGQGASVDLASEGKEALEKARAGRYNLVLMDVQMPNLDGHEVTRLLRKEDNAVPIIALTAHAMSSEREKCLESGCNDYLTKPLDVPSLMRLVSRYGMSAA